MAKGRKEKISQSICIGVLLVCVLAFLFSYGLFSCTPPTQSRRLSKSTLQVEKLQLAERGKGHDEEQFVATSEPQSDGPFGTVKGLRISESTVLPDESANPRLAKILEEIAIRKELIVELTNSNVKAMLQVWFTSIKRLKSYSLLSGEKVMMREQFVATSETQRAGPFGTVKALRTNPTVLPDESANPRLAKILEEIAIRKELIVALANSNVKAMLQVWFTSIKNVGITNYLVVALDDAVVDFCESNGVPVYKRDPDEDVDSIGKTGGNHAVSGLKYKILREFLLLGYSILLSDVDIVYLQNPFDYLYRDSDVESMSDGHANTTAYGYNDVFDEPAMGWARYTYTMRIWAYNSGFFYIRPTIPSIELLDRVADRLFRQPNSWDQAVFNEELFFPSHPGYAGLHAAKRTMDFYLFMNSKVLFQTVRKDVRLKKLKPVIVHINYHLDKLARMLAVVDFYVNGKQNALDPFPYGSEW